MGIESLLSLENPVFSNYAFYATLVVLKMYAMGPLTSIQRTTKNAYANAEDAKAFGKRNKDGEKKANLNDPDVERVRRNHLNDLENIPAFVFLGLLYVLTQPAPFTALWHFRIFAISRFLHTLCYQVPITQPSRALCYIAGLGVSISMAVQILMKATY